MWYSDPHDAMSIPLYSSASSHSNPSVSPTTMSHPGRIAVPPIAPIPSTTSGGVVLPNPCQPLHPIPVLDLSFLPCLKYHLLLFAYVTLLPLTVTSNNCGLILSSHSCITSSLITSCFAPFPSLPIVLDCLAFNHCMLYIVPLSWLPNDYHLFIFIYMILPTHMKDSSWKRQDNWRK